MLKGLVRSAVGKHGTGTKKATAWVALIDRNVLR